MKKRTSRFVFFCAEFAIHSGMILALRVRMLKAITLMACAVLALAPSLSKAEECRVLFQEGRSDLPMRLEDPKTVDLWLQQHTVDFDSLPEADQRYVRKTLQNPKLFALVQTLKGRVGFVDRMPRLIQGATGVYYNVGFPYLVSRRPWQGYRVDVLRQQDHPGSTFIHELAHWMTPKLQIWDTVARILAERKRLMAKEGFVYDRLPEHLFITGNFWRAIQDLKQKAAIPVYRLHQKLQDTYELSEYRYYTSTAEYIAYSIEAYFLTDDFVVPLKTGALLSREQLQKKDPAMFKLIDDKFR